MPVVKNNRAMSALVAGMESFPPVELDPELAGYVARGLAIEADGTIVAVAAADATIAATERSRFQDRVGYESVVNKVRLGDWASERLKVQPVAVRVAHAVRLADVVGEVALVQGSAVTVIISVDSRSGGMPPQHDADADADVVFRFHGQHVGEVPWLSDPDGYAEPIMVRSHT